MDAVLESCEGVSQNINITCPDKCSEQERRTMFFLINCCLQDMYNRDDLTAVANYTKDRLVTRYDKEHPEGLEKRVAMRKLYQERKEECLAKQCKI